MPTLRLLRTCRTSTSLGFTSFRFLPLLKISSRRVRNYPTGKGPRAAAPDNCRRLGGTAYSSIKSRHAVLASAISSPLEAHSEPVPSARSSSTDLNLLRQRPRTGTGALCIQLCMSQ